MPHASPETGEFCLLLYVAIRDRSIVLLRQVLRSIAESCADAAVKWILSRTRQFLSSSEQEWLDGALLKLWDDPNDRKRLSIPCYTWKRSSGNALAAELHTRVTAAEADRLCQIAKELGLSRAALLREIVLESLEHLAINEATTSIGVSA
jgi:hypothetical protein